MAFIALLLVGLSTAAAITAKFAKHDDDYVCRVTGQSYTRMDTLVKMYGKHAKYDEAGNPAPYGNADVTVFFASNLNNDFEKIPPNICHLFKNLREMYVESVGLKELDDTSFSDARNLKKIIFGKDHIEMIRGNVFSDCESLEEIQFIDNYIDVISDNAFAGQSGLKALTLKGNNLSVINPAMLDPLTGLIELKITNNPILQFSPDSFLYMTKLQALILNNNEVNYISAPLLRDKNQLAIIDLSNNQISKIDSNILKSWPNNAGVNLNDNVCVSASFDELGTDEWPMDEAAEEMKQCFNEESLPVIELENDYAADDIPIHVNKTSDESSLDDSEYLDSESSEIINTNASKSATNNRTDLVDFHWFTKDDQVHDEDPDTSEYVNVKEMIETSNKTNATGGADYHLVETEKANITTDSFWDYDNDDTLNSTDGNSNVTTTGLKVSSNETDKQSDNFDDEAKKIVDEIESPIVHDEEDSANKTKSSNETKPHVDWSSSSDNDNGTESSTTQSQEHRSTASPSDVIETSTPLLHSYEKTEARFYVSARNHYTCVLRNVETTLKHIIMEHKENYTSDNVSVVFIRDSKLLSIPSVIMKSFPNLKSLSVENSGLKSMDSDLFEFCGPSLVNLDLSNNKIERVRGDSLQKCPSLENVIVTNNPIDRIEGTISQYNPNLTITIGSLNIVAVH